MKRLCEVPVNLSNSIFKFLHFPPLVFDEGLSTAEFSTTNYRLAQYSIGIYKRQRLLPNLSLFSLDISIQLSFFFKNRKT